MATSYPSGIQTFSDPSGTSLLTSPDHAGLHTDMNDTMEAVQTVLGTTAGTSVLKDFSAGQFPARVNSGGTIVQTLTGGTINNTNIGTSLIVGGTANNIVLGTPTFSQGAIGVNDISTSSMLLGYAQSTGAQGSITTITDLTNLSVTVTAPTIARRIKITGWIPQIYSTVSTDRADFSIREGTVSLAVAYGIANGSLNGVGGQTCMYVGTASSGSHTYKLSLERGVGSGTISIYAGPESPAFILVEAV